MTNKLGKIKLEHKDKPFKILNNEHVTHNENVAIAKGLCEEMEARDKDMEKTYTIPIDKGYKLVTKEKHDEYIKGKK